MVCNVHINSAMHSRGAEEEDFPRGGASALSPLEVRKIKNEAEKDVLFGVIIDLQSVAARCGHVT